MGGDIGSTGGGGADASMRGEAVKDSSDAGGDLIIGSAAGDSGEDGNDVLGTGDLLGDDDLTGSFLLVASAFLLLPPSLPLSCFLSYELTCSSEFGPPQGSLSLSDGIYHRYVLPSPRLTGWRNLHLWVAGVFLKLEINCSPPC